MICSGDFVNTLWEKSSEPPRYQGVAVRATPFLQAVGDDFEAFAFDELAAAFRADRVFVCRRAADVARIDELQARLLRKLDGAHEPFGRRALRAIGHLVVRVIGGDMPWDGRIQRGDEFGDMAQFVVGIIEIRNDKRGQFDPFAGVMERLDRVQNDLQPAAEPFVAVLREAFQIDVGGVRQRQQKIQRFL